MDDTPGKMALAQQRPSQAAQNKEKGVTCGKAPGCSLCETGSRFRWIMEGKKEKLAYIGEGQLVIATLHKNGQVTTRYTPESTAYRVHLCEGCLARVLKQRVKE